MNENLIEELVKIENKYLPIIKILEINPVYKKLYRGFITIQSKINHNPELLLLGINPGDGAFKELKSKEGFPKKIISDPVYLESLNLDWFKKGNARGEFIEKNWYGYHWFEKTKKINNSFPSRMIDILYSYSEKLHPNKKHDIRKLNDLIENDVHNKIVYTNICPIATVSIKELKEIFNLLSKEKNIGEIIGTKDKVTSAMVKNFFRQRMIDTINVIKPKAIVLLGHSAYQHLTLLNDYKGQNVFINEVKLRKNDQTKYRIISFSRQGNWSPLIDEITKAIIEQTK